VNCNLHDSSGFTMISFMIVNDSVFVDNVLTCIGIQVRFI